MRIICGMVLVACLLVVHERVVGTQTLRLTSGSPSPGQEIDGEAGEIPARCRHCDVGWVFRNPPTSQTASLMRFVQPPAVHGPPNPHMKNNNTTPPRGQSRRAFVAHAALIATFTVASIAHAEEPEDLPPLVISALRTPTALSQVSSSVSVLDPAAFEAQGIYRLQDALNRAPGVISTSTGGQNGAVGSLLIRGTSTGYSQIVVDGMRMSDSNAPLGNFLGNAGVSDFGRIEVLRGPHGAIYGGESVGGVLWLETTAGTPDPRSQVRVEGGSFNSFAADARHQGSQGALSYFLSTGYETTDNDTNPSTNFRQWRASLRADMRHDDTWTSRITFRGNDSYFRNSPTSENHVDSALVTLQATGTHSDRWTSRFHLGFYQESYDNDFVFLGTPGNFGTDLRSTSFSTDQEIRLTEDLLLLAGGFYHRDSFTNTIGVDQTGNRYGFHSSLQWQPVDGLTLQQSGRWEDYDTYGDEFTWRSGAAYFLEDAGLTLRGGIGKSFRTPSYLDLFGSTFGVGNPNLNAESATGWDLGILQNIGPHQQLEVTWFQNRIRDQIRSFPAPPQNVAGTSKTQGIETGWRGRWLNGMFEHHLAWTWTDESIAGLPRNAVNASLDWNIDEKSVVGAGVQHFSSRSWGGNPLTSATITRIHGSHQITENLRLHARVENLFDERYELSDFFGTVIPGAGRGLFVGLTATW
jgi:vitamin B12 transporter